MYAAESGDYKTVEYLISKSVNPDTIDKVNNIYQLKEANF
jgi:hypothetical protein